MALTGFVSDAVVLADVAAVLKLAAGPSALPAYYSTVVPLAHSKAVNLIYRRLIARGYTPTQIAGWDDGPEVERNLATLYSLQRAGSTEAIPDSLARECESYTEKDGLLDTALLTANGVWAAAQDTPGTSNSGAPGFHPNQFPIRRPGLSEFGNHPDTDCGGIPGPGW
jgi:hypothetical protein